MKQNEIEFIFGNGIYNQEVVGESNYQNNLINIAKKQTIKDSEIFTKATLVLEDTNKFDANAVLVMIDGLSVGYLPRQSAINFRNKLLGEERTNKIYSCDCVIKGGYDIGNGENANYGVFLDIPIRNTSPFKVITINAKQIGKSRQLAKPIIQTSSISKPKPASNNFISLVLIIGMALFLYWFFLSNKNQDNANQNLEINVMPIVEKKVQVIENDFKQIPNNLNKNQNELPKNDNDTNKYDKKNLNKQTVDTKKYSIDKINTISAYAKEMNLAVIQFKKSIDDNVEPFKNERFYSRKKISSLYTKINEELKTLTNQNEIEESLNIISNQMNYAKNLLDKYKE